MKIMNMYKLFFAYLVANAIFFATFQAANALSVDKSNKNSRELSDLNSASKSEDKDNLNMELGRYSLFEGDIEKSIEDKLNSAFKDITKRCIHPITKRIFKCPWFTKQPKLQANRCQLNVKKSNEKNSQQRDPKELKINERLNAFFDYKRPYPYKNSLRDTRKLLQNVLKLKLPQKTNEFKRAIDNNRNSGVKGDEIVVVVGRNLVKGRDKKKYICQCREANCMGNQCKPSQNRPLEPDNSWKPTTSSIPNMFGPDILYSSRKTDNDSIYSQFGPIYNPIYYIQNIQRQKEIASAGKSSLVTNENNQVEIPQSIDTKSLLYFQNPLSQYSSSSQPVYLFNSPHSAFPVNNKFSINDCIRLYGPDFCALSSSTQKYVPLVDSINYLASTHIPEDLAPYYGELLDYSEKDYDEVTEPLKNDYKLENFYEDEKEEYLKSQESIDKALEHSNNFRHRTMNSEVGPDLVIKRESEEILRSADKDLIQKQSDTFQSKKSSVKSSEEESSNYKSSNANYGSKEISENPALYPDFNMELKVKRIEPVSKEIASEIPSVLGNVCAIETKKSIQMSKDKASFTENRQYTFTNDFIDEKLKELSTSSEHIEKTIERPILEQTEFDSNIVLGQRQSSVPQRKEVHSFAELSISEQEILRTAIIRALNNYNSNLKLTGEGLIGSAKESTPSNLENILANSVRDLLSLPGGNLIQGITDEIIRSGLRTLVNINPVQNNFPIRYDNPLEVENKAPSSANKLLSPGMHKDMPLIPVTERIFKPEKWITKATNVGAESNDKILGAAKPVDSEEKAVDMEPQDEIIDDEMDIGTQVTPSIRKYKTGAAMAVGASSRSRPVMTQSFTEIRKPEVTSSETDEMIEKTPIQYYSREGRLLDYKKKHQNQYYLSTERSIQEKNLDEKSGIPESKSNLRISMITQPKKYHNDKEGKYLAGMAEGSGMVEEGENESLLENVGYFENYEGSGNTDGDYNLSPGDIAKVPMENGNVGYESRTTVAEDENIDDQYTGAVFTESSGRDKEIENYKDYIINADTQLVGSSRSKTNYVPDRNFRATTDQSINENTQLLGSPRNKIEPVAENTFHRTSDRNINENSQVVESSRNKEESIAENTFHGTSDQNINENTQVLGSSKNGINPGTDRGLEVLTNRNNNENVRFVGSSRNKEESIAENTFHGTSDQNINENTQVLGSSKNGINPGTDKGLEVLTNRNNNENVRFVGSSRNKEESIAENTFHGTSDQNMNENTQVLGSSRNGINPGTDRDLEVLTNRNNNEDVRFVGSSRNKEESIAENIFHGTSDQNINENTQVLGSSKNGINPGTDRGLEVLTNRNNNENVRFVGSSRNKEESIAENTFHGTSDQNINENTQVLGSSKNGINPGTDKGLEVLTNRNNNENVRFVGSSRNKEESIAENTFHGTSDQNMNENTQVLGSSRNGINPGTDRDLEVLTNRNNNEDVRFVGSSRNKEESIAENIFHGTSDQNINENTQVLGSSKNGINPGNDRGLEVLTNRNNNENVRFVGSSRNKEESIAENTFHGNSDQNMNENTQVLGTSKNGINHGTDKGLEVLTNRNNNENVRFVGSSRNKEESIAENTFHGTSDQNMNENTQVLGTSKNGINPGTDRGLEVLTNRNNNENVRFVGSSRNKEESIAENTFHGTSDQNMNENTQVLGSSRNRINPGTDRGLEVLTNLNNNENARFVGSSINKEESVDENTFLGTSDRNMNENTQVLGSSRNGINPGTDRGLEVLTNRNNKENVRFVGSSRDKEESIAENIFHGTSDRNMNKNTQVVGSSRNGINSGTDRFVGSCIPKSFVKIEDDEYLRSDNPYYRDSIYLGRLQNRGNSEFMYEGNGVKLSLKLIQLNDGSFSLVLSNRKCDCSFQINCPCYFPRIQPRIKKRDNDGVNSMKDDSVTSSSGKRETGKRKTSVEGSGGEISKIFSKESGDNKKDTKGEHERYEKYVETLLDVNDIPEKDRAGVVIKALNKVVNVEVDDSSMKKNVEDKEDEVFQKSGSTQEKVGYEKNKESAENFRYQETRGYASTRIEMLKTILSWIKDLVFTAYNRKN